MTKSGEVEKDTSNYVSQCDNDANRRHISLSTHVHLVHLVPMTETKNTKSFKSFIRVENE